jgi:hypothetical protein
MKSALGLADAMTLAEVAASVNESRSTVAKLEQAAIRKLWRSQVRPLRILRVYQTRQRQQRIVADQ